MLPEGSDLVFDHRHNSADRAPARIVMALAPRPRRFRGNAAHPHLIAGWVGRAELAQVVSALTAAGSGPVALTTGLAQDCLRQAG